MGLTSKDMETMTQVKTQSVTKLKLAVATLAAVVAGNAALATLPGTSRRSVPVPPVLSCNSTATGITVQRELKNSCNVSTNKSVRYICVSPNVYKMFWQVHSVGAPMPCDGTPTSVGQSETFANVNCVDAADGIVITENYDSGCSGIKDYQYSCASDTRMVKWMNNCTVSGFHCADSDRGLNPVQRGQTVMFNALTRRYTGSSYDSCLDSDTVNEGYCSGGVTSRQNLDCPTGYTCSAGKCNILSPAPTTCIDPDGADSRVSSIAKLVNLGNGAIVGQQADTCLDPATVREAVCSGGALSSVTTTCASNEVCRGGACAMVSTTVALPELYLTNSEHGETASGTDKYFIGATIVNSGEGVATAPLFVDLKINGTDGRWMDLSGAISYSPRAYPFTLLDTTTLRFEINGIYMSVGEDTFTTSIGTGNVFSIHVLVPKDLIIDPETGATRASSFRVVTDSTGLITENDETNNGTSIVF